MINETWRNIPKFQLGYEISDQGHIRIRYTDRDEYIEPKINSDGFAVIHLCGKTWLVHRLVASTFIENPEDKKLVRHLDGNKLNNVVSNLQWITASEYSKEAFTAGKISGKRVECVTNGITYLTISSAEIHLGIPRAIIEHSIETEKVCCGFLFREVPEDVDSDADKTIFIPVQEAITRSELVRSREELAQMYS